MKAERLREALTLELDEKEINLRRYVVLGGVFHLDLLQQPSQAQQLANKCYLTLREFPISYFKIVVIEPYKNNNQMYLNGRSLLTLDILKQDVSAQFKTVTYVWKECIQNCEEARSTRMLAEERQRALAKTTQDFVKSQRQSGE